MTAAAAATARDQGATLALEAEASRYELEAAVRKTARALPILTSDEVWNILREWGIREIAHPNAMGAAFLKAAREGIITPTDQVRRSARITAHRRKVTVWTSCIFSHPENLGSDHA